MTAKAPEVGFGTRLLLSRRERGLTQKQLADRCGVDDKTYRGWENGRYPSQVVVYGLAHLLDVPVAWLATGRSEDIEDSGRYHMFVHPRLPLADGWHQHDREQQEWTTRESLTDTESGNGHEDSPPKRSAATGPSTDHSSHGSKRAA